MQEPAPSSDPGLAGTIIVHKNRLQEYAQKASIPLPLYQTLNEGYSHAPQFRATVMIDGATFRSYHTFAHRKEAEQDVAKLAFECLSSKIKQEAKPSIHEGSMFCKSIVHEYTVKMNLEKPTYTTTSLPGGKLPMYVSSVVFDGIMYTGAPGKNKKAAEQMAARAFIESVLANSYTSTLMSQIIKSKGKFYSAMHKGGSSRTPYGTNLALRMQTGSNFNNNYGTEVMANLAYSDAGKFANAVETLIFPSEARKPKEEFICEPSSGIVRNDAAVPNEAYIAECNQANDGPLVGQSMQYLDSQGTVLDSGRKRPNEYQESQPKKTRTDGGLLPTPPVKC